MPRARSLALKALLTYRVALHVLKLLNDGPDVQVLHVDVNVLGVAVEAAQGIEQRILVDGPLELLARHEFEQHSPKMLLRPRRNLVDLVVQLPDIEHVLAILRQGFVTEALSLAVANGASPLLLAH